MKVGHFFEIVGRLSGETYESVMCELIVGCFMRSKMRLVHTFGFNPKPKLRTVRIVQLLADKRLKNAVMFFSAYRLGFCEIAVRSNHPRLICLY